MLAVDTNVVVRLLADDDPRQAAASRSLFETDQIWIAKTVLLETAWVLRRLLTYDEDAVTNAITSLLGLDNVTLEDAAAVAAAVALTRHGLDFADALHVVGRPPGVDFVTFDQSLVKRAARAGESGVSLVAQR